VRRAQVRGFTLLELLVALIVFAALSALVYGTVRIGSRSWQAGTERIEETDAMRIGWRFVQRALNDARPEPSLIPDTAGVHFIGGPSTVEFIADLPAYLGAGGLHLLSLGLEEDGGSGLWRLVLRRAPLRRPVETEEATPSLPPVQQTVLAEHVTSLAIRYYGTAVDSDGEVVGAGWQLQWQQQEDLPRLVMVMLQQRGGKHWPLLVAHPRLARGKAGGEDAEDARDADVPDATEEARRHATVD
jgi:general secretion pathway protein J